MANVKFLFKDEIALASVVADNANNQVSTLPAENLQQIGRTKVYRTTGTGTNYFYPIIDFPDLVSIDEIYLIRHNLTTAATIEVILTEDPPNEGSPYFNEVQNALLAGATGFIPDSKTSIFTVTPPDNTNQFNKMYLRVNDASNPDGYLEASRLIAGKVYSTTINAKYGLAFGWDEDTKQARSMGGTLHSDLAKPYRWCNMQLPELTHDEMTELMAYVQYVGMKKDFMVNIYPEDDPWLEQALTFNAKFKSMPKFEHFSYDRWRVTFNLVEA